jgi:hypothetical protein
MMCESILSTQTQQNERYNDVGVKCGWIFYIWQHTVSSSISNVPWQRGPQRLLKSICICSLCFCLSGRIDHLEWVKWHSVALLANTDRKICRYLSSPNIHSTNVHWVSAWCLQDVQCWRLQRKKSVTQFLTP